MEIVEEYGRRWPVRERKAIERLSFKNDEKAVASKAVIIKKGKGMRLKDIPNVAYNLSKRKADDNLQKLHKILFRKQSNKYYVKRNISQFSGFVWEKNEDKERARLRERINKCVKDSLFNFCKLLNIPVSRASKKEDFSAKLLKFLESPQATTEVSLAEREKMRRGKRQRRMARVRTATSAGGEAAGSSDENLGRNNDSLPQEGGNAVCQPRKQNKKSQDTQRKRTSKKQVQGSTSKAKTALARKDSTSGPVTRKGKSIATTANADPRKEELLPVVANILMEVDLDVATFEDVHSLLEKHFNLDFSHRKVEVRRITEETLLSMAVSESEDEE